MAVALPHLFLLLLLPYFSVAQTNGTVRVGASITATEDASPWRSASGDFAFGFQQLGNQDVFLLSIWYDKLPGKTTVWYANGDKAAPRGSKVELTADRGLVLSVPQGVPTSISDPIIGAVAHGIMEDTGNFVLVNTNSENLWESFNATTDTLLPTQTMENDRFLSSRLTETNFSRGRFQLSFREDGDLVLRSRNIPSEYLNEPYYNSNTGNGSFSSRDRLEFNESGYLYIMGDYGLKFVVSQGDDEAQANDFYHRMTLNFDGSLTHYRHPKAFTNNSGWSVFRTVPENICQGMVSTSSGVCGYNRICRPNTDGRPDCQCTRGFSLLDPADEYRGCIQDFVQDCRAGPSSASNLYEFETVTNIDWPLSDYERLEPYTGDMCKDACLNDCMCAVAILGGSSCWKKKLPLSNGRVGDDVNRLAFIKVKKTDSPPQNPPSPVPPQKNQDTVILLVSVFLGSSVFVNFILVGVICVGFLVIYRNKLTANSKSESVMERNLRSFSYKELADATDGFKEELGRGSFGIVYKGVVQMGSSSTAVAVKMLDRIVQDGDKEFKTEVNVIGQTHHKNLVELLGYCYEGPHRLLVYEFLSNGTLAGFLFGDLKLSWNQRTQIALGIARGLLYLHDECSTQIIHCDIKPQNILLDDWYNARISDFGLAKLLRMDQSETHTGIRGTKGYVAPEWFRNMPITVKTDVYSFGVLLLEIICCRRNVDMEIGGEKAILTYWVYDCYEEGTLGALVENDAEAIGDWKKLERFLIVAIWCIQEDPSLRPTMKKVLLMLEGIVEVAAPPCPFPFSTIGRS